MIGAVEATTANGGLVRRRQTRTRAALVDAAERAFMGGDFHDVKIEDVAAEAEVSVGSVYNLFGSKAGLYLAVAERATELFGRYIACAYAASESPLERVMAGGDAYLRFHLEQPGAFRFIAFEGVGTQPAFDEEDGSVLAERTAAILGAFVANIEAAVDAGEARSDLDPLVTAKVLFGAWNGMIALALRSDDLAVTEGEVEALILQARRIVVEGMTAPSYRDSDGLSRARLLSIASPERASP